MTNRAGDGLAPCDPIALLGPAAAFLTRLWCFLGAGWTTWVPDATHICLARSTRQGFGEQVFRNATRSYAAKSDEGSRTVLARQWRLVGESREGDCSANAAGQLIVLVPTKMGGSGHYEWPIV